MQVRLLGKPEAPALGSFLPSPLGRHICEDLCVFCSIFPLNNEASKAKSYGKTCVRRKMSRLAQDKQGVCNGMETMEMMYPHEYDF